MFSRMSDRNAFGYPNQYNSAGDAELAFKVYPTDSSNLEGWWAYENSGNVSALGTWGDFTANSNDGTLRGDAYVDSNGVNLDGSDNVNCGNDSSLDVAASASNFTASCWFKSNSTPDSYNFMFKRQATSGSYQGYGLALTSAGKVDGLIGVNPTFIHVVSPLSYDDNVRHQAVWVRNGTSLDLYVDGAWVAGTTSSVTFASATVDFRIGSNSIESDEFFVGSVDDVQIYSRALDSTEILANYNARK